MKINVNDNVQAETASIKEFMQMVWEGNVTLPLRFWGGLAERSLACCLATLKRASVSHNLTSDPNPKEMMRLSRSLWLAEDSPRGWKARQISLMLDDAEAVIDLCRKRSESHVAVRMAVNVVRYAAAFDFDSFESDGLTIAMVRAEQAELRAQFADFRVGI